MKTWRHIAALLALVPVFATLTACGDGVYGPLTETDTDLVEVDELPPMETEAFVGCNKTEYVGTGSCTQSCTKIGTCVSGAFKWSCSAVNYAHWKGQAGENNYFKTSGPISIQYCQNTNPVNCPGFCN